MTTTTTTTTEKPPAPRRRWPRRLLAALAAVALLLGAAFWFLGREATLQALVQKIAGASGGELVVGGVSGSLYGKMHVGHVVYRSPDSSITAENIDIAWSPLQYFSQGMVISELHVASLAFESTGPAKPAVLPQSLAPPFQLSIADARVEKLTLLGKDGNNVIEHLRLRLNGDRSGWHLQDASAATPLGLVTADATLGAMRPFALAGKASLTQGQGAPAAGQKPAQLQLRLEGNLSLLQLSATAQAQQASGDAKLTLAPFDPIILRAATINATGIDPSGFNPAWPKADLRLELAARIATDQSVSGKLMLSNQGTPGPLDQQRLPLRAISGQLAGTLTATTIDAVLLDLAQAGTFHGGGTFLRGAPGAVTGNAVFKLHTDGIDLKAVHSKLNTTKITGDISLSGDAQAQPQAFSAVLAQDGLRLDVQASVAGALLQIRQARLLAGKGSLSLSGQASLKDQQEFQVNGSASHFNPAAFGAYPAADINADIGLNGNLLPGWQVAGNFALRASRLFGQPLSGSGKLTADALHVSGVDARLALGQNTLALNGNFGAPGERLLWRVAAAQLSAVQSGLTGALAANGVISGSMAAPRSSFDADARGLGLESIKAAKAAPNDSLLHVAGDVWLGAATRVEIKASGSAQRFNPSAFGPYPAGSVNAAFTGGGRLGADWRLALDLALQPSTLSGAALTGHARVDADAAHIASADIDLHLGPNSLQASGSFGAAREHFDWKIDAPRLAVLGPQFGGALSGSGQLSGTGAAPSLAFTLAASKLRLGAQQIQALRASATLGSGLGGADPLLSDIDMSGYTSPALNVARARLQTSGTRAAHALTLSLNNDDFDAALQVRGGWNGGAWNGTLTTLQNRGRFAFTLQAPVALRIAGPASSGVTGLLRPEQIALANAVLTLPGGSISVQSLEKTGPLWRSTGQAAGVPLNYLAQLSPAWRENVVSDLTLGAAWSLKLQAPAGADPAIDGMLHVFREKGDMTVGAELPLTLGLRVLDVRIDVLANALRLKVALDGARAGNARLDATVQMLHGRIAKDSALSFTGSADMPSLAWLAPLSGQPGLDLDGALKLALTGSGSLGAPVLNGDIAGEKLVLNWSDQGVKLRNGQLQARLSGDQLLLQRLSFDGIEGHAQADGWLRFANAEASMQLKLSLDQLQLLARPDRTLVVSGQSTLSRDQKHFQLDGKFKAERATIELAAQDTPTQSDDVVVLGKARPGSKGAPSLPLNIDIEADLGDAFYLKGKGVDAQLAGSVHIVAADRRPPRAIGNIRVVSGTYAAYGQKLAIERGVITFTGAYDNPGLSILAVRKRPEGETLSETNVEAGVEVRGTALAPLAKLVSTPSVPDSEKLAWLVLGHSTESTAGNEMGLLTAAAGALFGGSSGGSMQARLASTLGVDELGLAQQASASATGLATTVVTVGKRLSQRAYLSFEQGASTATSLVKLRYKLNPRITLQFQTGANSALDVLYTWAFD